MEFVLLIVLGLGLYAIISALVRVPGQTLRAKFVKLGQLKGRTKVEIVAAVGPPRAIARYWVIWYGWATAISVAC